MVSVSSGGRGHFLNALADILRHCGVDLCKRDFVGYLNKVQDMNS